jgi:hypothetical protein
MESNMAGRIRGVSHRRAVSLGLAMTVAAIASASTGCQGDLRTVPLTASRMSFVRDVPVPMSFELVDQKANSVPQAGFRMIQHSYFGYAEPAIVYVFYRDEMPRYGWHLLSDQNVQGTYRLAFRKNKETALVTVTRQSRSFRVGALATVIVKPIGVVVTDN